MRGTLWRGIKPHILLQLNCLEVSLKIAWSPHAIAIPPSLNDCVKVIARYSTGDTVVIRDLHGLAVYPKGLLDASKH